MDGISLDKINVECGMLFERILEISLDARVNKHAFLHIKAVLPELDENEVRKLDGRELILKYKNEEEETVLFAGFVTNYQLVVETNFCCIEISCISASIRFDQEKHCRSFQDTSQTYGQILRKMSGKDLNIIAVKGNNTKAKCPFIQYKETDWETMGRIAGYLHTVLIPNMISLHPQVAVGIVDGKKYRLNQTDAYKIKIHFDEYRRKSFFKTCVNRSFVSYHLESREDYQLGDKIEFRDDVLIVAQKYAVLEHGMLEFQYELGREELFGLHACENSKICGLSLTGTVLDTRREKLKVQLDIDQKPEEDIGLLHEYDYVPITGTLLYSMPETGAKVTVYFPSADEAGGMVTGTVHEEIAYPDHENKCLRTNHGKCLVMDPDQLKYSSLRERQCFQLIDRSGIEFLSDKSVRISAGKRLLIQSDSQVESDAQTCFHFENRTSADSMDISGTEIIMTTERAVTGGVPHELGHKPDIPKVEPGIDPKGAMAPYVLGGIAQGSAEGLGGAVMAGIPAYGSPAKEQDVAGFISISRSR